MDQKYSNQHIVEHEANIEIAIKFRWIQRNAITFAYNYPRSIAVMMNVGNERSEFHSLERVRAK